MSYLRKFKRIVILSVVVGSFVMGCSHSGKKGAGQSKTENSWQENMRELSFILSSLLPYVLSDKEFFNSDNRGAIERETKALLEVTEKVHKSDSSFGKEPTMAYVSNRFKQDMSLAYEELTSGSRRYARHLIRKSSSYCITCHTQSNIGPEYLQIIWQPSLNDFSNLDQARFYVATRQYEKGLDAYDRVLTNKGVIQKQPWLWETAAREAMAVAIRTKKDPAIAQELVARIFDAKTMPSYMESQVGGWRNAVKQWRRESKSKKRKAYSASAKLKQVESLLSQAKREPEYPLAGAGLVQHLRASAVLHDLMLAGPKSKKYQEAVYWAGVTSELLSKVNIWPLEETYYERCVRHTPKTIWAKRCYARLENIKFSQSAGRSDLPKAVKGHLNELRSLIGIKPLLK